tara:strand:- start:208 stop:729 length:522 start_codon:yes stop_codon:yes gene_type:complete
MKKLFFLIMFLFSLTKVHSQSVICHPDTPIEECLAVYMALNEYIDDTNVTVIYNSNVPLYPSFGGITWKYHKHLYVISLNISEGDKYLRLWTIFHEVGHVIDLYNNVLQQQPIRWKGKVMDGDMKWKDRPWEKSAQRWAKKMWKKFVLKQDPNHLDIKDLKELIKDKPSCLKY